MEIIKMSFENKTNITINTKGLKYNIQHTYDLCKEKSIDLAVVSKSICADETLISIIEDSCAGTIADSRLDNFEKIKTTKTKMLIRPCTPYEVSDVVRLCDISFQTNLGTVQELDKAAAAASKTHNVLIMLDIGDMRDGIYYTNEDLILGLAKYIHDSNNLCLAGIAANYNCFKGLLPDENNMSRLSHIRHLLDEYFDVEEPIVSGGTSSSISLLTSSDITIPPEITQFRVGEAIMLGRDPSDNSFIEGYDTDVFTLNAPLLEVLEKPVDDSSDKTMLRGVLAVGKQDLLIQHLIPIDENIKFLGGCSDELVLDLTNSPNYKVGDTVSFKLEYGALMSAFARVFIKRIYN